MLALRFSLGLLESSCPGVRFYLLIIGFALGLFKNSLKKVTSKGWIEPTVAELICFNYSKSLGGGQVAGLVTGR